MKVWIKLLVLGAVPILAVTAVVDQGLAADKGSQLIFTATCTTRTSSPFQTPAPMRLRCWFSTTTMS